MTKTSLLAILVVSVALSGCSGESRNPVTGPSPAESVVVAPPDAAAGDRSRPTAGSRETAAWAAQHGWSTTSDGLAVEGTDVITAINGGCPGGTIVVRGVPVALAATTVFDDPLTCGLLTVDMKVKVWAVLTYTPIGYDVQATRVAIVDPGSGGGKKASGQGVIGAITGSCPTLTLVITGTRVSTTETTEYVNGSCASLRPGTQVTIDGELRPGGTAIAEKIEIHKIPGRPVSGDGPVDTVEGTCPNLTMTVRGIVVVTDGATTFTGGECSSIGPGTHIDVTGDYDGTTVAATAVAIKKRGR
jgi:hypothetical protein